MKSILWFCLILVLPVYDSPGQDKYKIKLDIPLMELPQNTDLPQNYPSMNQALEWSSNLYDIGFWGIDELGSLIFPDKKPYTWWRKFSSNTFRYGLALGFSRYASDLPVPFGGWAHEEFHRSVLGVNNISSKNGNWFVNRWDGTVYGVSDQALEDLKAGNNSYLLYSYLAGIQYEILLNEKVTLEGVYDKRNMSRAALLLYNAWYVFDYFSISASSSSDSSKILIPPDESSDPSERDFAGSDLTAWIFDMFNYDIPYTSREAFPGGNGVNRRIGFSDLSSDAKDYLKDQKKLSLFNFLNPAIFFINRIRIGDDLAFNIFTQYTPTHFGNDLALFLPICYRNTSLSLDLHRFNSYKNHGIGLGIGLRNIRWSERVYSDYNVNLWEQPVSFFELAKYRGAQIGMKTYYSLKNNFAGYFSISGKTDGWMRGNPYLDDNILVRLGIVLSLADKKYNILTGWF